MKSRHVPFIFAAIGLVSILVAGIWGSNWLTHELADLHGPIGCIVLVPAVLVFLVGSVVLVTLWVKQGRE